MSFWLRLLLEQMVWFECVHGVFLLKAFACGDGMVSLCFPECTLELSPYGKCCKCWGDFRDDWLMEYLLLLMD